MQSLRFILGGFLAVAFGICLMAIPAGSVSQRYSNASTPHWVSASWQTQSETPPYSLGAGTPTDLVTVANTQPKSTTLSNINLTQSSPIDIANHPFKIYKDPGTTMWIKAIIANPVAASGSVTTPLQTVIQMDSMVTVDGKVTLTVNLPLDSPSGTYTLNIQVTKGQYTAVTQISFTEGGQQFFSPPAFTP
jgi:hypothetical protein